MILLIFHKIKSCIFCSKTISRNFRLVRLSVYNHFSSNLDLEMIIINQHHINYSRACLRGQAIFVVWSMLKPVVLSFFCVELHLFDDFCYIKMITYKKCFPEIALILVNSGRELKLQAKVSEDLLLWRCNFFSIFYRKILN